MHQYFGLCRFRQITGSYPAVKLVFCKKPSAIPPAGFLSIHSRLTFRFIVFDRSMPAADHTSLVLSQLSLLCLFFYSLPCYTCFLMFLASVQDDFGLVSHLVFLRSELYQTQIYSHCRLLNQSSFIFCIAWIIFFAYVFVYTVETACKHNDIIVLFCKVMYVLLRVSFLHGN